jgi:hypothetical protein
MEGSEEGSSDNGYRGIEIGCPAGQNRKSGEARSSRLSLNVQLLQWMDRADK